MHLSSIMVHSFCLAGTFIVLLHSPDELVLKRTVRLPLVYSWALGPGPVGWRWLELRPDWNEPSSGADGHAPLLPGLHGEEKKLDKLVLNRTLHKSEPYVDQPLFVPCSTVLLLGGSCGSCLTLRVDEDVTEEERDPPLWRCPLTQNNMTESRKQKGEGKGRHGGEKKCEYKGRMKSVSMGRRENDIKVITFAVESAIRWWNLTCLHVIPFIQWTKCWQVLNTGWTCCNFTFLDVRRVSLNIRLQNKDMTTEAIGGTSMLETRQQQQHFDQTSYSQSEAKWGLFGVHSEGLCCQ